jgi:type IV secretory pathway VirB2 component (pilin)
MYWKNWPLRNGSEKYELKKSNKIIGETTANNITNEKMNLKLPGMKGASGFTQFKRREQFLSGLAVFLLLSVPTPALASIENMMGNLQTAILNVLAPMVCVGGIIFSGFKLAMGDESAKRMLFWSCVGTVVAFTAPSILSFLQNRVAS